MFDFLQSYFQSAFTDTCGCVSTVADLFVRAFGENDERIIFLLLAAVASVIAYGIHEFGHAWMADKLGDPQPRKDGRVTLAPWGHIDPLGFLVTIASSLIGFPLGWGKPLRTDPETYSVPRKTGIILVALAGPVMSFLGAVAVSFPARFLLAYLQENGNNLDPWLAITLVVTCLVMIFTVLISVSLFVSNLLPLSPMDGAHVVAALLPADLSLVYVRLMKRYGMYIFFALTASNVLSDFLAPIIIKLFLFLMGL
ncbi:MAG: site-2 protease family protein [Armatimonadetes bacterium]|nr:site-2 protease family protein [Armatimonadota bacterium]